MKRIISTIALAFTVLVSFAQMPATQAKLDSFATVQLNAYKAFTSGLQYQAGVTKAKLDSVATDSYVKQTSTYTQFNFGRLYINSKTISYSNLKGTAANPIVISGLSFDQKGDSVTCITLFNSSYVHITNCRMMNSRAFALYAYGCDHITFDYNYLNNLALGGYAQNSKTIKFDHNQVLNINGNKIWKGHAFAYDTDPASGGNSMSYNIVINQYGVAQYPHDMFSPYHSSGLPGDSIMIVGNVVVGGQWKYRPGMNATSDGAAAFTSSDQYGDYQVVRGNISDNGAPCAWQTVGTGIGIKVDHNIWYVRLPAASTIKPLCVSVQNPTKGAVYFGYNRILVYNLDGSLTYNNNSRTPNDKQPLFWNPITTPPVAGWNTNIWQDQTLVNPAAWLPTQLITYN